MNIKISELYTKCEDMAKAIGLSVNDRFVFDLQDDTSLESIKDTFKGIDKILLPGYGRYMVLMVSNEKPNVLMAVFPETEEFDLKLVLFNVKNQKTLTVGDKVAGDEDKMTLDNFEDVLATDDVEKDVNDFLFADEDEEEGDKEEDKAEDDEKKDDEEADKEEEDKEDEVIEPSKDEEEDKGDEEASDDEKDDEDKNPADLGDGEPADVEAGDEPETKDDEPSDAEKADDEEGDEVEDDDDDVIEVVDDEDEEVDEDTGATGDAEGTPAEVGDNADKEIVVSEGDAGVADQGDGAPADVGTGADEDKPAKEEGVTGEGDGDPADVGDGADADKDAKEEGVTGEGDGKPADVGEDADKEVVKEGTAPVDPAPAPAPAPADTTPPVDPAPVADTVTDPEKDIRALIKFYTDELARKTADETVSTEVVSGIQAIIAGLVKNLEAMTDLQDTETEEAKAAAKAAKDDAKKEEKPEEVSEDGVPPSIEANPPAPTDETPAAKVGGEAGVPVDQNVTLSTANMTPDLLTVQPDADTAAFDAATSADLVAVPGDPMNDLAGVELPPEEEEPAPFDATVEIPDVTGAVSITTDAPVDVATGEPKETPAGDDAAVDALPSEEPPMFGADGLPSKDLEEPSDKFIDDQIASLGTPADTEADPDAVSFVPGGNVINWSDNLYDDGKANATDNAETVPAALKELKEYAERIEKTVTECGTAVNEVTIGRINKFCNLCATAYDTWHKIQDALNASNPLREAMEPKTTMEKMDAETDTMAQAGFEDDLQQPSLLRESAEDFAQVQNYIKSIKHLL